MLAADRSSAWALRHSLWTLTLLVPGVSWAAFVYVGLRVRHRPWLLWGLAYALPMVLVVLGDDGKPTNSWLENVAVGLLLVSWAGALAHGLALRMEYLARLTRRENEEQGRLTALATGAAEKLDLNHASADELALLPGVGVMGAEVALRLRRDGPYRSVEHFAQALGLPPAMAERLRPLVLVDQEGDQG